MNNERGRQQANRFGNNQNKNRRIGNNNNNNNKISSFKIEYGESSGSQNDEGHLVFVGPLAVDKLNTNELNLLVNGCVNKLKLNPDETIKSINAYKESLYVMFASAKDAHEAANYFNGLNFKSYKLTSFYMNSSLGRLDRVQSSSNENLNDDSASTEREFDYRKRFKSTYVDCEIIVDNRQLKKYADSVNEKLYKELFGINTYVKYLNRNYGPAGGAEVESKDEDVINASLFKESMNKNLLYLIYINQSNEQYNSVNVIILNKWRLYLNPKFKNGQQITHKIKENKNMPLNKAIELLKSDYHDYISYLKETSRKAVETKETKDNNDDDDEEVDDDDNPDDEYDQEDNQELEFYLNDREKRLFNLVMEKLSATNRLNMYDLDFLSAFLEKNRHELLKNKLMDEINESTEQVTQPSQPIQPPANHPHPPSHFPASSGHQFIPPLFQPNQMMTGRGPSPATNAQPLMSLINNNSANAPTPALMSLQTTKSFTGNNKFTNNNQNNSNKKY